MINKILTILFLLSFTGAVLPQNMPSDFRLNGGGALQKTTTAAASGPLSNSISDVIAKGDTVWLGTGKGISLSTDGGSTWTNFYNIPAIGSMSISAIGFYNGVFWAALGYTKQVAGGSYDTGGGLVYTTDMGKTWVNIPQPVDEDGDSTLVYGINNGIDAPKVRALAVTVEEQNITYDIDFMNGYIWIASWAGGIRKANIESLMANPNLKWDRVLLPSDKVNSISPTDTIKFALSVQSGKLISEAYNNHMGFSIKVINDNTIYVGTAGGINKSTDGGVSWVKFSHQNQDSPISGNFIVGLGYQQATGAIWGVTWRAEDNNEFNGLSTSTDGGETWQTYLADVKAHNVGFSGNAVIAASDDGAFRSDDNGSVWVLPSNITDSQTGLKLAQSIFYSADSYASDNVLWLGSGDGLLKYTEGASRLWSGTWKLYMASSGSVSKSDTYAYPNPFSPKLDICKIKYSTGGTSASVTIRIYDFSMNYVRTVVQDAERGGVSHAIDNNGENQSVIDYWDGKDDNGKVVPNGVYFYTVDTGSGDPAYGKILVIQ